MNNMNNMNIWIWIRAIELAKFTYSPLDKAFEK